MADTKIKAGQFFGVIGHGTDGYFLMTNADGSMSWSQASTGPSVTSVTYPGDDTAADPAGGQTVVLTGTGFGSSMTVSIGGTTAPSVAHDSSTQLTITTPAKAAGDYDIVVTNTVTGASGTFVNGISYNGVPTWTTPAGSLGTFESETTISTITLQATEPDGGTITFNITNGALPSGLSLTGANIDGTTTAESSTTLYSFTIEAIDDENQATPRNFSITVNAAAIISSENFTINTYTGNGSTQSIEGKIGTAADFNGSSSKIDVGNQTWFDSDFTLSMWFYPSDPSGTSIQMLANKRFNDDATSPFTLFLRETSNSSNAQKLAFNIGGGGSNYNYIITSNTYNLNSWNHVAVKILGTSMSITLNGTETTATFAGTRQTNTETIRFCNKYQTDNDYPFDGKIDQVRIFDKALSSSEVTTLYGENNASSTKSTTDIFDDGSGIALYEFEKGAKDTGGVNGYIGAGGVFNGSSSKITTSLGVNTSSSFSISAWIKSDLDNTWQSWGFVGNNDNDALFLQKRGDDNRLRFIIYDNTAGGTILDMNSTQALPIGEWYHYAATINGSVGNLYINGVNVANNISYTHSKTYSNLTFGQRPITQTEIFDGSLDQIRIFNKAISSSEVTTLYGETSASATKSTTDIFNDGSGVALYELNGNALDSGDFKQVTMASASATSGGYVDTAAISGKYYWEVLYSDRESSSNTLMVGVGSDTSAFLSSASNYFYYAGNGDKYTNGTQQSYSGVTYTEGDIIGVALDLDGDTVTFYKNGVSQGQAFTGLNAVGGYYAMVTTGYNAESAIFYFDSNDWTYSAPSGYSQWDDAINASIVTLNGATLDTYDGTATNVLYGYDGTPTNVSFVGTSFQPDFVWIKSRNHGYSHHIQDVIRGAGPQKDISSDGTWAEGTFNYGSVDSFDTNGFTVGSGGHPTYGRAQVNESGKTYVAWAWKAGGAAVSNTDGSITSQVSANPDAGFSIVKYTGNLTASTVGHGLSSAPELIIVKRIDNTSNWFVYSQTTGNTKYLNLDRTAAAATFNVWNNTSPTSSVFSLAAQGDVNASGGSYIAYCFNSVDGYQKVGYYTSDASVKITTGFEPRWIMIKYTGVANNWWIMDTSRYDGSTGTHGGKLVKPFLEANTSLAEASPASGSVEFVSDGFYPTNFFNSNGVIYLAIA